jgi:hypothetical protein
MTSSWTYTRFLRFATSPPCSSGLRVQSGSRHAPRTARASEIHHNRMDPPQRRGADGVRARPADLQGAHTGQGWIHVAGWPITRWLIARARPRARAT